ncbi:MAG: hypothetical protein AVDCRST_MAG85-3788, partial [uncultured Solirubrobacteraceae bacterium]
ALARHGNRAVLVRRLGRRPDDHGRDASRTEHARPRHGGARAAVAAQRRGRVVAVRAFDLRHPPDRRRPGREHPENRRRDAWRAAGRGHRRERGRDVAELGRPRRDAPRAAARRRPRSGHSDAPGRTGRRPTARAGRIGAPSHGGSGTRCRRSAAADTDVRARGPDRRRPQRRAAGRSGAGEGGRPRPLPAGERPPGRSDPRHLPRPRLPDDDRRRAHPEARPPARGHLPGLAPRDRRRRQPREHAGPRPRRGL